MQNIRVHKLASELGVASKVLLLELKSQGVELKNHMSSVDAETADIARELFKKEDLSQKPEPPKEVEKKPEKPLDQDLKVKAADLPKEEIKEKSKSTEKEKNLESPSPSTTEAVDTELKEHAKIIVSEVITVKELAEKLECKPSEIIKTLMDLDVIATINQSIDPPMVSKVAEKFNIQVEIVEIDSDEFLLEEEEDKEEDLVSRPPVVTIMGHVDHGKTSLLDAIRETNITDKEAGGITQHIGAYKVKLEKGEITFLDTPGHEAFTAMRARGAKITDIVVLVVAADDGIMPQTIEAIHHAEAANVPIIVAVNKIDKPGADPDVIKQKLTEFNLVPEEWGGDTIVAEISAKQKTGIENLLELILLQSEMMELKANPKSMGRGVLIEANLDKGRGPIGTVLVQRGTIEAGQPFVVGLHHGKVRALINDNGKKVNSAGPSTPVEVLGFSDVPNAGDIFIVVDDERKARQIGNIRLSKQRLEDLSASSRITLDDLYSQINKGEIKELRLVIKADVQGSVQALTESLEKLSAQAVCVKIIHGATGGITETDVMLAAASNAVIIGFNVRPSEKVSELSKKEKVDLRLYTVIYKAISDIKSAMEGLLEPVKNEVVLGRAEVREVFNIPKVGAIAGCYVLSGKIKRNSETRLIRDNVVIYQGKISSLRRFKEDAKEVLTGFECGIGIEKYQDIKSGDIIEPFSYEEVPQTM